MAEKVILFDKSARKEVLELFDKTVDKDGFIVEKNNPSQRILSSEGEEIRLKDFAAISKGSLSFHKSDLISLLQLSDKIK